MWRSQARDRRLFRERTTKSRSAEKNWITISPGAPAMSDPVDLKVPPLSSVAVSLYFPNISPTTTWHNDARQTGYVAEGNVADAAELKDAKPLPSRVFLDEILSTPHRGRAPS